MATSKKPTPAGKNLGKVSTTSDYKKGYAEGVKAGKASAKTYKENKMPTPITFRPPYAKPVSTARERGKTVGTSTGFSAQTSRRSPRKMGD